MAEEIRLPRPPREQIPRHGALAAQSAWRWRSFLRGLFRPPTPPQVETPDATAPPPNDQRRTGPGDGPSFPLDGVAFLDRDEERADQRTPPAEPNVEEPPPSSTQEETWLFAPSAFDDLPATITTLPPGPSEPTPVVAQDDPTEERPPERTGEARALIHDAIEQMYAIRNQLDEVPGDLLLPTFLELEYLDEEWQRATPLLEGDGRMLLGIVVDIDRARPAERAWILEELRRSSVLDYRLLGEAYEVALHPEHTPEQSLFEQPERRVLWMVLLGMICDPETIAEHLAATGMPPQEIDSAMQWLAQTFRDLYGPVLKKGQRDSD